MRTKVRWMDKIVKVIKGTGFSSISAQEIEILEQYLYCIDKNGMIIKRLNPSDSQYNQTLQEAKETNKLIALEEGQYLLPGFIDLHIHAPQWGQSGTALDIPLHQWLDTYTFPLESKFNDNMFAEKVYSHLVDTLLAHGTTTGLYFATIHEEASYKLAEICAKKGQRGLVGKVVMDDLEQNPEYYRDKDTKTALEDTESFIKRIKTLQPEIKQGVYPVIIPRFVPSCTDQALEGLGELTAKYDVHVTSHCSESDWEHGYVKERFGKNDAQVLNDYGLLTDKSVMAHCNFLSDADALTFKKQGTAIAHCPISNAYFANGVIPIKKFHEFGVEIGLGTDLSGGFDPSVYSAIRQAVISSRMLEDGVDTSKSPIERSTTDKSRITVKEAFYFATAGGGESLSLPIGRLVENYAFDAQVIDTRTPNASMPIFNDSEPLEDIFQKLLYLTKRENITSVWVQGEKIQK
ncbi:guanine deaminase [Carnobacterium sp.]|uniref:guanine deaminase n=1 Tax=Carnobacterium sp. TaxID=48221 RepID=UPI003C715071